MGEPRMTAERPEWQELRDRHGQDWIEPTPANLQWLSDQGYAHLAELIALLQAELVVVRERAERLDSKNVSETTAAQSSVIGAKFVVEMCPECGVLHLGPTVPWHSMDCSEPDMQGFVVQIQGPATKAGG